MISSFVTLLVDRMRFAHGRSGKEPRRLKLLVLSTPISKTSLFVVKSWRMMI